MKYILSLILIILTTFFPCIVLSADNNAMDTTDVVGAVNPETPEIAINPAKPAAPNAPLQRQTSSAQTQQQLDSDIEFALEPINPTLANFQLEAESDYKPAPLIIDGKAYLMYELLIANVGNPTFKITRVDIVDADHPDKVLASYNPEQLLQMTRSFQLTNPDSEQSLVIHPGVREVLYFMPQFADLKSVPHRLMHKFVMETPGSNRYQADDIDQNQIENEAELAQQESRQPFTLATVPVDVNTQAPVILAAPLHGEHWLAANGPSNSSIHRRARIANHGTIFFPERFAIDFMQFGPNGKPYQGSAKRNENYFGYGANLYSVATGKVVAVYDGIADSTPGRRDYPINLGNMAGNFVIIDIGNHHYAFYSHLIPHSIKVKRGDIVLRGQLIGKLGNSGNSDAPHLHFHVIDRPSGLSAQGLPYAFEHFSTEEYKIADPDSSATSIIYSKHRIPRKNELVKENALMNFGGKS